MKGIKHDPNHVKFIQEGLVDNKNAYRSNLVAQIRLYFVLKAVAFQILLQALPYSPRFQIVLMILIELIYAIGSLAKFLAIHHFRKKLFLVHIFGQTMLLVIFLGLVLGMTFKGYKYGNGSTLIGLDLGKWEYGQNACILVVTIALLVELFIFIGAIILLIKNVFFMLLGLVMSKDSIDAKREKNLKKFISFNNGIFYHLADPEELNLSKELSEKHSSRIRRGKIGAKNGKKISKRAKPSKKKRGNLLK